MPHVTIHRLVTGQVTADRDSRAAGSFGVEPVQSAALSTLYQAPPVRTCVMQCHGHKMLASDQAGHE